jgi:GT2 family glycosyltransferase
VAAEERPANGSGPRGSKATACVVIGRNEGDRLRACLESLAGRVSRIVYVDSGSTDGSVELARSFGATVLDLDLSRPFTAARARNEGYRGLTRVAPETDFVQFVDGDCAVAEGWLEEARAFLESHPDFAVACGRRREKYPAHSIYNAICDIEWDSPVGEARACGGDAMMRCAAFDAVGGYDPSLIAGEEPELCVRLRKAGWRIMRLPVEMTAHDAAIERAGQWWTRTVRSGYAYAQGMHMHGRPPERHCVKPVRRVVFWTLCLPSVVMICFVPTGGLSALLLSAYFVSGARTFAATRRRGHGVRASAGYALACTVGRFAELQGVTRFLRDRWVGRQSKLIEYKVP